MIDAADAFSDDSIKPIPSTSSRPLPEPSPLKNTHLSAKAHLYPIDESEDFHDPFSDLSLFLSKKIKSEIQKHGSMRQWSTKIEANLLAGILPEFKSKFPKYRLGVCAIKKVWQKVCYYYGKVETHKEAIKEDGKLNVEFMIKENLRGYGSSLQSPLPPYHAAHQIAIKLSECIAALDGTKPCMEYLTKTIWSVQKHLLQHLSAKQAKQAFEDYDHFDKLIVKYLLEVTSLYPCISQKDLEKALREKLSLMENLVKSHSFEESYQILCLLLSRKIYPHLSYHKETTKEQKEKFFLFLKKQIAWMDQFNLSPIESCQRLLALYPLAECTSKKYSTDVIRKAIKAIYQGQQPHDADHGLKVFIQAELHFLKRKEVFKQYQKIEQFILETLISIDHLPRWRADVSDELEVLFWHSYQQDIESPLLAIYKEHVEEVLFDTQSFSFKKNLYTLLESIKSLRALFTKQHKVGEKPSQEALEEKIYLWSIQGDMISRWLHFDSSHLFLKTLQQSYIENNKRASHTKVLEIAFEKLSNSGQLMYVEPQILRKRLSLFYKYFWYHDLAETDESTFARWVAFHVLDIKQAHKDKSKEHQKAILEHRLSTILPLTPVSKKLFDAYLV